MCNLYIYKIICDMVCFRFGSGLHEELSFLILLSCPHQSAYIQCATPCLMALCDSVLCMRMLYSYCTLLHILAAPTSLHLPEPKKTRKSSVFCSTPRGGILVVCRLTRLGGLLDGCPEALVWAHLVYPSLSRIHTHTSEHDQAPIYIYGPLHYM